MWMPFIVVSSSQNRTFLHAQENKVVVYKTLKAFLKTFANHPHQKNDTDEQWRNWRIEPVGKLG